MGQKRIHLVVRGRVQGVYFRATAQREARQHGLSGWIKNRPDGAVEIVAEGEEDEVVQKSLPETTRLGRQTQRLASAVSATARSRRSL